MGGRPDGARGAGIGTARPRGLVNPAVGNDLERLRRGQAREQDEE